jgi:hypothetical protein
VPAVKPAAGGQTLPQAMAAELPDRGDAFDGPPLELLFELHQLVARVSKKRTWGPVLAFYGVRPPKGWAEPPAAAAADDLAPMADWLSLAKAEEIRAGFAAAAKNNAAKVEAARAAG